MKLKRFARKFAAQSTAFVVLTALASIRRSFVTEKRIALTELMSCRVTVKRKKKMLLLVARKFSLSTWKLELDKSFDNLRIDKHRCRSGECIEPEKVCDGTYHCQDQSDEEESICLKSYCPKFAFRCRYGACVSKNFRCSGGEPKCADGSDEDELLCGSHRHHKLIEANATGLIPTGSCKLPVRTDFRYVNNIFQEEYEPGAFVNDGEYIEVTCTRGLAMNVSLNFDFSNTCNNTRWTKKWTKFPECQSMKKFFKCKIIWLCEFSSDL